MLVDIGHKEHRARCQTAEKGQILAIAAINGHIPKPDTVVAGRIDQLQPVDACNGRYVQKSGGWSMRGRPIYNRK